MKINLGIDIRLQTAVKVARLGSERKGHLLAFKVVRRRKEVVVAGEGGRENGGEAASKINKHAATLALADLSGNGETTTGASAGGHCEDWRDLMIGGKLESGVRIIYIV